MKNQHVRIGVEEKWARNSETGTFPFLSHALSWPLAFLHARLKGGTVIVHVAPSLPIFKDHLCVEKERAVSVRQNRWLCCCRRHCPTDGTRARQKCAIWIEFSKTSNTSFRGAVRVEGKSVRSERWEKRWCYLSGAAEDYSLSTSFAAKEADMWQYFCLAELSEIVRLSPWLLSNAMLIPLFYANTPAGVLIMGS